MEKVKRLLIYLLQKKTYLLIIGVGITAAMLLYRRPDALSTAQFWSEDGELFFAQSYHMGFVSFFHPYVGYLHAFPRLVSISAEYLIPKSSIPLYYNVWSFSVFLLLTVYIWFRGTENKFVSLLMILCLTMLPMENEVYMTITNQQWSLALALLLPLAYPKKEKFWTYLDTAVILLAGLTGPFVVFFLPILLFCYFTKNEMSSKKLLLFAYGSTTALQLLLLLIFPKYRVEGDASWSEMVWLSWKLYYQQFVHLSRNIQWTNADSALIVIPTGALFVVATLLLGYFSFSRAQKEKDYSSLVFILASTLLFAAMIVGFRKDLATVHPLAFGFNGPRYFFIPLVTFFWCIFNLLKDQKGIINIFLIAFVVLFLFRSKVYPSLVFRPLHWEHYVAKFDQSQPFIIPINPVGKGWKIEVDPKDHRNYPKYIGKILD